MSRCDDRRPHPAHGDCIGVTEEQAELFSQAMATIERLRRATQVGGGE